tara:strand:- start:1849 stop:1989 length:141 start_codon:yes stop_codon:yes gene_type:complete
LSVEPEKVNEVVSRFSPRSETTAEAAGIMIAYMMALQLDILFAANP